MTTTLDGLKAIAAFLEAHFTAKAIPVRDLTPLAVYKLAKRKRDPLPTYKRRGRKGGRLADPDAVAAWLARQKFAIAVGDEE